MTLAARPVTSVPAVVSRQRPPVHQRSGGVRSPVSAAVAALDLALLVVAFATAHVLRFPGELPTVGPRDGWTEVIKAPVIVLVWLTFLSGFPTRGPRGAY